MSKFRRSLMWAALILILLLIFLSIYGAFIGAENAKHFFNTLPLSVYWLALTVMLIWALMVFRRLVLVPSLLLIHVGCVLVLTGSMWGSKAGHELQKRLFGIDKIPTGYMVIHKGDTENLVVSKEGKTIGELPFHIRLKDFRTEYYKPEYLQIETHRGQRWKFPVEINSKFSLGPEFGTVTILRRFENLKVKFEGNKTIIFDDPQPGSNPALEVQIKYPDGNTAIKYVFEHLTGHIRPEDKFLLSYQRIIRDYISEVQVIKNNETVAEKSIEVNHPLHFGGYHFYQYSYDAQAGRYTVLGVVSDTGLNVVYTGFLMLCFGAFWHFWLRDLSIKMKSKGK